MKYSLIYSDPPWSHNNKASRATAENHYSTMPLTELKRLPVWDLAAEDCVLAMWWSPVMPLEAIQLAEAWGFSVRNMKLFTWGKLTQHAERHIQKYIDDALSLTQFISAGDVLDSVRGHIRVNLGNYTRSNSEDCLIAVRGRGIERIDASVRQLILEPISSHSKKPDEARKRLVQLFGDVPRIELFARQSSHGFDVWGDECGTADISLTPGCARTNRVEW